MYHIIFRYSSHLHMHRRAGALAQIHKKPQLFSLTESGSRLKYLQNYVNTSSIIVSAHHKTLLERI